MRFLNRVFFINSATIPYAEVMLDGNVHLIGTQGVGKSTLLRAILFFYNADSLKLGISKEKKNFADYYFPYSNSYVIYEVRRETGPFCIIVAKTSGKVNFRFIDGAFQKEYFMSADGIAFDKWEETRKRLDEAGIDYSVKIDRYEDYRNVLYGNPETSRKDLSRYSILQSKQYQNIPRTIQNVFLNSKLEAEFIKQTIIMSLNEQDIIIDLTQYAHHLKDFERQLADIQKYKEPSVRKVAEHAINALHATRVLLKEKNQLSLQLAWSAQHVKTKIPTLKTSLFSAEKSKNKLEESLSGSRMRHENKILKIREELGIIENDIKKIKERSAYYTKLKIHELLVAAEEEPSLELHLNELKAEKQLITAQYGEISQKYAAIIQTLENNFTSQENILNRKKTQILELRLTDENQARDTHSATCEDLRHAARQAELAIRDTMSEQQLALTDLRIELATTRSRRLYEVEIKELENQIHELKSAATTGAHHLERLDYEQKALQQRWENEVRSIEIETNATLEKLQTEIAETKTLLADLENKLATEDTFYLWLNKNIENWQQHIGKVSSQDILFNNQLSPTIVPGSSDFFGVRIDLDAIESQAKTPMDLVAEQLQLEAQLTELDKNFQHTNQDKQDRLERLRRKYQPLIKGIKEQVTEQGYLLERGNDQLQQATLALKELESKAATEKKILIESLDDNIVTATTNLANSSLALEAIDANLKKQVRAKEKELDKKIDTLHSNQRNAEMELEATRAELAKELQRSVAATQLRQQEELNGHGVDTNRLSELEDAITQTNKRLAVILQNRAVVIEYLKDKRELFDKADELKTKKQAGETQVDYEQKRFTQVVENAHAEIKVQEEKIRSVTEDILRLQSDLASYEDFSISENYIRIEPEFKQVNELYANEKSCRYLIDKINEAVYAGLQKSEVLKENLNRFAGNFSSANVFNFKTSFTSNDDYVAFADDLNEFIHNSKIEEYEKRVNERFATIINTVGNQTSSLMSRAGEIQKVITQINNDFQTRNFVGAIRKIELKLDQSTNRVVQLLLEIKKFNDEYSYDLGGMNLFSSADQQSKNQKATDLLRNFGRAIAEYKIEVINLSDSFELKFRIEENDNDTGWVEKLANVGSEGTDVLVKAMINIMLLNVFKNDASRKFKDFRLHCMMDEIGKLHPNNVRGILQFANDRNIFLINGSPTENNALDYKHIYKLEKDSKRHTRIKRIISRTSV